MKKFKVAHLTSVHFPLDARILYKECCTLTKEGYEVTLVAPYERDETVAGVNIRAVPNPQSRFERFTLTAFRVFRKAIKEKADLYHFHDPELLPVGVLLKILGKRVVYDIHEDVPQQILSKQWIPSVIRKTIAKMTALTEAWGGAYFRRSCCSDTGRREKVSIP